MISDPLYGDSIFVTVSEGNSQWYDIASINLSTNVLYCQSCSARQTLEQEAQFTAPTFRSAAWSPNSDTLAFAFISIQKSSIILIKQGEVIELITETDAWYDDLAFSPDGNRLVYVTGSTFGSADPIDPVCYISLDIDSPSDHAPQCISIDNINIDPSWATDGESVIFTSGDRINKPGGAPTEIYLWNIANQTTRRISNTPEYEILPQWSPLGSQLAYLTIEKGEQLTYTLWIANADGSNPVAVQGPGSIQDFDWSPDGTQIVFTELSDIPNEPCDVGCLPFTYLKIIDLETGEIRTLTDGTQWIGEPDWRP
jgi:Tol biopolymer transport system component